MFGIGRLMMLYRELDERCSFRRDLNMRLVILEIKDRLDTVQ